MMALLYAEEVWRYVKPFGYNTGTWQTDRQTDGRTTEFLYQYRALLCWRAIKTGTRSKIISDNENVTDQLPHCDYVLLFSLLFLPGRKE